VPVVVAVALPVTGGHGAEAPSGPAVRASSPGGTLSLSNSRGPGAILSASGLAPGHSTSGEVTITNEGTLAGELSLSTSKLTDSPGPGGARLSERLALVVQDLTGSITVYSGTLASLDTRALGTIAAGQARTYRFTATLPNGGPPPGPLSGDNAYQGASVSADYRWTATAEDGNGNGGGAGGGGAGGGSQIGLTVQVKKRQPAPRRRRLVFYARCDRPCTLSAETRLAGQARRALTRRVVKKDVQANRRVTLNLKLSRKAARTLGKALRRKHGTRLRLSVTATDASGVRTTIARDVQLKRSGRGKRQKLVARFVTAKNPGRARR
jgi:spore coat-associated protein N